MGPGGPVLRSKFMTEGAPQPASTPGEGIEVPPRWTSWAPEFFPPRSRTRYADGFFGGSSGWRPGRITLGGRVVVHPPTGSRVESAAAPGVSPGRPIEAFWDGHRVVGEEWGEGPPVYLVHGWGGQRPHLAMFVKPLVEAGYRVVAFDLPSHNESDPGELAPGRTTATECADAIAAVIETHGPAHAVVAHSLGANATALAAAQGAPVGRLVFFAPMGDFPLYLDLFAARHASAAGSARAYTVVWKKSESPCRCMRPT